MFERYTERARRTLFFARYEASQMGSVSIDTEHLLLGLLRESKGVIGIVFSRAHVTLDKVSTELYRQSAPGKKVSTSVEIPFSAAAKRVLQHAAEEADRLLHHHIGAEHLLLGLLREESSVAASILRDYGLRLDEVRQEISRIVEPKAEERAAVSPQQDLLSQVDRIKAMVRKLEDAAPGGEEVGELVETIVAMLDDLRSRLSE
jgi:ATP-dependent Clp protease ATP-binding subunit ClpC